MYVCSLFISKAVTTDNKKSVWDLTLVSRSVTVSFSLLRAVLQCSLWSLRLCHVVCRVRWAWFCCPLIQIWFGCLFWPEIWKHISLNVSKLLRLHCKHIHPRPSSKQLQVAFITVQLRWSSQRPAKNDWIVCLVATCCWSRVRGGQCAHVPINPYIWFIFKITIDIFLWCKLS